MAKISASSKEIENTFLCLALSKENYFIVNFQNVYLSKLHKNVAFCMYDMFSFLAGLLQCVYYRE